MSFPGENPGRDLRTLFSSEKMGWQTPPEELEHVRRFGAIGLDPCTTYHNPVGAARFFTPRHDGLAREWWGFGLVFVNPPYGRELPGWVAKCVVEAKKGAEIIALVPARTDTRWWHSMASDAVCFRRGRIRFVGASSSSPFPSAYVYWGVNQLRFETVFSDIGLVY